VQPSFAFSIEPSDPTMRALPGDPHGLGDMRHRHLQLPDPLHEQQPAVERQTSVTVTHEDLRVVKTAISTAPGVFALRQRPVTNVAAEYN
jgi:hypothetical protein